MYIFYHSKMLAVHVSESNLKRLTKKPYHHHLFNILLVGANLTSLECIDCVASGILKIPDDKIRKVTRQQIIHEYLNGKDFIDRSGSLL